LTGALVIDPPAKDKKELILDLGNKVTMKLVLIPAGKFMMGSPKDEKGRQDNESIQHEVTIAKPFYFGVFEVTRGQFAAFVKDSGYQTDSEKAGDAYAWDAEKKALNKVKGASWKTPGFEQTDEHPVTVVSHNDAVAFCDWLGKKTVKTSRLPTEAEWEYACRAGTKAANPWGEGPDGGKGWANCGDQTAKRTFNWDIDWYSWDDGYAFTAPVGKFRPNAFGLYDMIGNVWEWCSDWYEDEYYMNSKNQVSHLTDHLYRVLRGGSWRNVVCRCAIRSRIGPDSRFCDIGFRIVVEADALAQTRYLDALPEGVKLNPAPKATVTTKRLMTDEEFLNWP
jgi:formylglycine-generating enzyme